MATSWLKQFRIARNFTHWLCGLCGRLGWARHFRPVPAERMPRPPPKRPGHSSLFGDPSEPLKAPQLVSTSKGGFLPVLSADNDCRMNRRTEISLAMQEAKIRSFQIRIALGTPTRSKSQTAAQQTMRR